MLRSATQLILIGAAPLIMGGCSILVGNIKPVTEKSDDYRVLDLAQGADSDWLRLSNDGQSSDRAWQSQSTSSIISINTSCRKKFTSSDQDLRYYAKELLLGVTDVTLREERELALDGVPALETTIEGKMQSEKVRMKAIVLKRSDCLYDLMYFGKPGKARGDVIDPEGVFERFVGSLRFR